MILFQLVENCIHEATALWVDTILTLVAIRGKQHLLRLVSYPKSWPVVVPCLTTGGL